MNRGSGSESRIAEHRKRLGDRWGCGGRVADQLLLAPALQGVGRGWARHVAHRAPSMRPRHGPGDPAAIRDSPPLHVPLHRPPCPTAPPCREKFDQFERKAPRRCGGLHTPHACRLGLHRNVPHARQGCTAGNQTGLARPAVQMRRGNRAHRRPHPHATGTALICRALGSGAHLQGRPVAHMHAHILRAQAATPHAPRTQG